MAAATVIGASASLATAAALAVNFKGDNYDNEFGKDVSGSAYGIDAADWATGNNTAGSGDGGADNITVQGVGISWTFNNDWAQSGTYAGSSGEDEVFFGYLDDGGSGADITITGLTNWLEGNSAATYEVTIFFSTGQVGASFQDATLKDTDGGSTLGFLFNDAPIAGASGGWQGVSNTISDLSSDTLFIDGGTRAGAARGSIAGFTIVPVPEPSSAALLGLGSLALLLRRRR